MPYYHALFVAHTYVILKSCDALVKRRLGEVLTAQKEHGELNTGAGTKTRSLLATAFSTLPSWQTPASVRPVSRAQKLTAVHEAKTEGWLY
jgi:hypothetical protein